MALRDELPPVPDGFAVGSTLGDVISRLMIPIFTFAGMIALLFLIWGGFRYLTSRGDPKSADAARGIITSAVIGLLIVLFSAAIFVLVGAAIGINPLNISVFVPSAYAFNIGDTVQLGTGRTIGFFTDFGKLFTSIVKTALFLGSVVFLFMIIWGGFKYLSSGGDQKASGEARGTLTSAIIGLVIIIVSFVIIEVATNLSQFNGFETIFT